MLTTQQAYDLMFFLGVFASAYSVFVIIGQRRTKCPHCGRKPTDPVAPDTNQRMNFCEFLDEMQRQGRIEVHSPGVISIKPEDPKAGA